MYCFISWLFLTSAEDYYINEKEIVFFPLFRSIPNIPIIQNIKSNLSKQISFNRKSRDKDLKVQCFSGCFVHNLYIAKAPSIHKLDLLRIRHIHIHQLGRVLDKSRHYALVT